MRTGRTNELLRGSLFIGAVWCLARRFENFLEISLCALELCQTSPRGKFCLASRSRCSSHIYIWLLFDMLMQVLVAVVPCVQLVKGEGSRENGGGLLERSPIFGGTPLSLFLSQSSFIARMRFAFPLCDNLFSLLLEWPLANHPVEKC